MEAFLRSECVWIQFWAELETPEQAARYKEYLDNYVQEQKQLGRSKRPVNTFISDVMSWMDVIGVVSNDNRVLMRLSFLFLIVCVLNTVGLLMAKFLGKGPEIALRRAMGANRGAIVLQNLFEVVVIGVLGGFAGVGLAWLGLALIGSLYQGYRAPGAPQRLLVVHRCRIGGSVKRDGRAVPGVAFCFAGAGRIVENPMRES